MFYATLDANIKTLFLKGFMSSDQKKFYVTTLIYYVTACLYLGVLYSTVLLDAVGIRRYGSKEAFF